MANNLLFISSIISTILHLYFINNISIYIYAGLLTSLLNHKFTNIYFIYLDRITIFIGFIINLIIIYNTYLLILLLISVKLFILAKITNNYYYHFASHLVLTYLHILIYE